MQDRLEPGLLAVRARVRTTLAKGGERKRARGYWRASLLLVVTNDRQCRIAKVCSRQPSASSGTGPQAWNDFPQPQLELEFGLLITNPAP